TVTVGVGTTLGLEETAVTVRDPAVVSTSVTVVLTVTVPPELSVTLLIGLIVGVSLTGAIVTVIGVLIVEEPSLTESVTVTVPFALRLGVKVTEGVPVPWPLNTIPWPLVPLIMVLSEEAAESVSPESAVSGSPTVKFTVLATSSVIAKV